MKQNCKTISVRLKVDLKNQNEIIAKLINEKVKLDIEIEQGGVQIELYQYRNDQLLCYSGIYTGGILATMLILFLCLTPVNRDGIFLDPINFADGSKCSFPVGDELCEMCGVIQIWKQKNMGATSPPSLGSDSGF